MQDDQDAHVAGLLERLPLFEALSEEGLRVLAGYMSVLDVYEGDVVFLEEEAGDYVLFVAEGSLDVRKRTSGGELVGIATLQTGDSIGEMCLIDPAPRSASVVANEKCTLLTLSKEDFDNFVDTHPRSGVKVLRGIAKLVTRHLRATSSQLATYSGNPLE